MLTALTLPGVVTSTLAAPAAPAGVVAVIVVALETWNEATAAPPMLTLVALVKPVPVIVTDCPPPVGPDEGEIAVTVGADT